MVNCTDDAEINMNIEPSEIGAGDGSTEPEINLDQEPEINSLSDAANQEINIEPEIDLGGGAKPSSAATSPSWWLWRRKSLQIHASSTSDTLPTANVAATDSRALVQEDVAAGEGEAHPRPSQDTPLFGYEDEKSFPPPPHGLTLSTPKPSQPTGRGVWRKVQGNKNQYYYRSVKNVPSSALKTCWLACDDEDDGWQRATDNKDRLYYKRTSDGKVFEVRTPFVPPPQFTQEETAHLINDNWVSRKGEGSRETYFYRLKDNIGETAKDLIWQHGDEDTGEKRGSIPRGWARATDEDDTVYYKRRDGKVFEAQENALIHKIRDGEEDDEEVFEETLLPEDSFSLLVTTPVCSLAFLLSIIVFILQIATLTVLLWDALRKSNTVGKGNWIGVPVTVDTEVRVSQYLAIFFMAFAQDEVTTAIRQTLREYTDRKHAFEASFPNAGKNMHSRWRVHIVLRFVEGIFSLFATFIYIMQQTTVWDVIMNFAVFSFVTNLDDVAFRLFRGGFAGNNVRKEAKRIQDSMYVEDESHLPGPVRRTCSCLPNRGNGFVRPLLFFAVWIAFTMWAVYINVKQDKRGSDGYRCSQKLISKELYDKMNDQCNSGDAYFNENSTVSKSVRYPKYDSGKLVPLFVSIKTGERLEVGLHWVIGGEDGEIKSGAKKIPTRWGTNPWEVPNQELHSTSSFDAESVSTQAFCIPYDFCGYFMIERYNVENNRKDKEANRLISFPGLFSIKTDDTLFKQDEIKDCAGYEEIDPAKEYNDTNLKNYKDTLFRYYKIGNTTCRDMWDRNIWVKKKVLLPLRRETEEPSSQPSPSPSSHPSGQPSLHPSSQPSSQPSPQPSSSLHPSSQPSPKPSRYPSEQPSSQPSSQLSTQPSPQPSFQPSSSIVPSLSRSAGPSSSAAFSDSALGTTNSTNNDINRRLVEEENEVSDAHGKEANIANDSSRAPTRGAMVGMIIAAMAVSCVVIFL